MTRLLERTRREDGFGLIELLMAMLVLNIGILAIVAAFQSGAVAIRRASRVSTAATIADSQMELYRALTYSAIRLHTSSANALTSTDNTYSCDDSLKVSTTAGCGSANRKTLELDASNPCATSPSVPNECNPSRTLWGPDKFEYRVDTYIVSETPPSGRALKKVTVVVRDARNLTQTWARQTSTFDQSTG